MTSQEEPERLDAVVMELDGSLERAPTSQEEPTSLAAVVVEPGSLERAPATACQEKPQSLDMMTSQEIFRSLLMSWLCCYSNNYFFPQNMNHCLHTFVRVGAKINSC